MTNGLEQQVRTVVAAIMRLTPDDVGADASAQTVRGWDSLNHLKLVLALEEEFGVTFTEEQIVQMLSVSKITSVVGQLLSAR